MRFPRFTHLLPLSFLGLATLHSATALRFSRDTDTIERFDMSPVPNAFQKRSSSSDSKSGGAASGEEIVSFLQVLQRANIKSQACWINLVNATQGEIGSCLQLDTFSQLIAYDPASNPNDTFADAAGMYLSDMCSQPQCSQQAIQYWQPAFDWDCGIAEDAGTPLVQALNMTLKFYTSAYRNLACDITYNGTSTNCLSEILGQTQTTNDPNFFSNIIAGLNLDWYSQSFFGVKWCTGCMYEMFRAVQFLIPMTKESQYMHQLGGQLQTCDGSGDGTNWANICDGSKPNSLSVSQNTDPTGGGGSTGGAATLRSTFASTGRSGLFGLLLLASGMLTLI